MIRVGDLTLYEPLPADRLAPFPSDRPRNVRITFNAPQRSRLFVVPMADDGTFPDVEPLFLAVVDGLEEVEFYALGSFAISSDSHVYFRTMDGQAVHAVVPDAETFTRIAERRVRNPELEHMQMLMERNLQRRMAPVINELESLREAQEAWNDQQTNTPGAPAPVNPAPGTGTSGGAEGVPPAAAGTEGASVDP